MGTRNPKVDAYIAQAKPFALPILEHLRDLVHRACPGVDEAIKWGFPFFTYKGAILGNMSAFKEHCSFGFWGSEMGNEVRAKGLERRNAMGSLGRITSLEDLPADTVILGLVRKAAKSIDEGTQVSPMTARSKATKAPKAEMESPELMSALKKNKKAAEVFAKFSPTARREYIEWIVEAKREETREKRLAQAVEWIAEGKQRNWKYQKS